MRLWQMSVIIANIWCVALILASVAASETTQMAVAIMAGIWLLISAVAGFCDC